MAREKTVRRRLVRCGVTVCVVALATAAMAQQETAAQSKGGKTPPPPPPAVTAEFRSVGPNCVSPGDRIAGDSLDCQSRVYPPSNGTEGAFINSNGGLTIHLDPADLARTMWFDFTGRDPFAPCSPNGTPSLTTLAAADVTLGLNAWNSGGTAFVGLQGIPVGESRRGSGTINFSTNDQYSFWTLRFKQQNVKITHDTGYPDKDTWTIVWDQSDPSVNALLQCTKTGKGRTVIIDDSQWVMPFMITVKAQ